MIGLSPAKKTAAKKTTTKKSTAKKATKKTSRKKTPAKKTAAKKSTAKKSTAKKSTAKKKSSARKPAASKKTTKKTAAKKSSAKKTSAKKSTVKKTTKATAKSAGTATGATKVVEQAPGPKSRRGEKPVFKTPIRKLPVQKKKTPRPAKLDAATLKSIREQLVDERGELVKQQEELEEDTFKGTQSEITGEVGLDEDFADAGTATFDRERDLSIRNNIRDLIEQVDRAVRRIDEGTYGTCERCGQPIDAARLKALPHASLCLDCKRREERVR